MLSSRWTRLRGVENVPARSQPSRDDRAPGDQVSARRGNPVSLAVCFGVVQPELVERWYQSVEAFL